MLKKAFDDDYYRELIVSYLKKFNEASRTDIRLLLTDKLPDILDERQKENKIRNLLYSMHKAGIIERTSGNAKRSKWRLKKE